MEGRIKKDQQHSYHEGTVLRLFGVREHIPVFIAGSVARGAVFTEAADAPGVGALAPAAYTRASSTTHLALWVDAVLG